MSGQDTIIRSQGWEFCRTDNDKYHNDYNTVYWKCYWVSVMHEQQNHHSWIKTWISKEKITTALISPWAETRLLHSQTTCFYHKWRGSQSTGQGRRGRKPYITIVMKEPRSSVCTQGPARVWDIHYECQLDSIENHHGDKPLGMSVRKSLDWAN